MVLLRPLLVGALAFSVAAPLPAQSKSPKIVLPQDLYAQVNGLSLHYLDWGGRGDLLLMLPGWSHTAYTFAGIAPAFTDRFHVVALTRRGHGASAKPDSGFTIEALVDDIVSFVGALGAKRVVLVGHSFGGRELPLVAERLGERTRGLVFLDAVYDWPLMTRHPATATINHYLEPPDSALASYRALDAWYRWRDPETWGPVAAATLRSQTFLTAEGRLEWQLPLAQLAKQLGWMATTGTDYAAIRVPTLAIWANMLEPATRAMKAAGYGPDDVATFRGWVVDGDQVTKKSGLAALRRAKAPVTIIGLSAPHLLHWYDPVRIIREMNGFLNRLGR